MFLVWHSPSTQSASNQIEPGTKSVPKSPMMIENELKVIYNWAAPEVLAGKPHSVSSDLYSLSTVLWEALHGMEICSLSL